AAIFNPQFGDVRSNPEERTNNLFSVDGELRFRNLDRYYFPSRDLRLYGEFYWDDTCGECGPGSGVGNFFATNFLPAGSTVRAVGGMHLLGTSGQTGWLGDSGLSDPCRCPTTSSRSTTSTRPAGPSFWVLSG